MTDPTDKQSRHLLLAITGAGETHCAQCNLRTYFPDLDNATVSACPIDGSDRQWGDPRLPECLEAEADARRLREVEAAAHEYTLRHRAWREACDAEDLADEALDTAREQLYSTVYAAAPKGTKP